MRIITKDNSNLKKPIKAVDKPKRIHKKFFCKICDTTSHNTNTCWKKKLGAIKQSGKYAHKWNKTRKQWFKDNHADFYICYLCFKPIPLSETTLDHVIPRSRSPELRYEQSNLKPCCYACNSSKGSKVY